MYNLLKIELNKALKNRLFLITLLIGFIITISSAVYNINNYYFVEDMRNQVLSNYDYTINPDYPMFTLFNHWIGGEFTSAFSSLFFLLVPLFAAIPYGWSYFSERKVGYVKNVMIRTKKSYYFLSKYIAVFISGGLVVVLPLFINFLIVSCFVPAYKPDVFYDIYYAVPMPHMWSYIFYSKPFLYVGLFLLFDFVFAGLIATLSLAVTFIVNHRFAVILIPFFLLLGIHYTESLLPADWFDVECSPIYFMRAVSIHTFVTWWVVLAESIVLFLLTFLITIKKGTKSDVF